MNLFAVCLAVTNAAALTSWALQWRGLIGEKGITPAQDRIAHRAASAANVLRKPAVAAEAVDGGLLGRARAWMTAQLQTGLHSLRLHKFPNLFAMRGSATDADIMGVFGIGYCGAVLLASNWAPSIGALICCVRFTSCYNLKHIYILAIMLQAAYSSMTAVGQPWLGLQVCCGRL
jgi:hypothetical protein